MSVVNFSPKYYQFWIKATYLNQFLLAASRFHFLVIISFPPHCRFVHCFSTGKIKLSPTRNQEQNTWLSITWHRNSILMRKLDFLSKNDHMFDASNFKLVLRMWWLKTLILKNNFLFISITTLVPVGNIENL